VKAVKKREKGKLIAKWTIEKYANAYEYKYGKPYEISSFKKNLLLNEGINAMWTLIAGGSETAYNATNARLGVGDSSTAEDASQTGLLGTNQYFKSLDAGYPQYGTNQKYVARATFGGTEANFTWNEFTIDNGSTANKNMNRKVSAQGTKTSGQTWVLTLEITLS